MGRVAVTSLIALLILFIGLLLFVSDYQEDNLETEVTEAILISNAKISELEKYLQIDRDSKKLFFVSEQLSNYVDGEFSIEITSQGYIIVEKVAKHDGSKISIKRYPYIENGKVVWGCFGSPQKSMPTSCLNRNQGVRLD